MKIQKHRWPALVALLLTCVMTAFAAGPATSKKKAAAPAKKSSASASSAKKRSAATSSSSRRRPTSKGKATTARRRTPAAPPRQASPSQDRYREIQQALVDKGYSAEPVDGVWGPGWVTALRRFQADQNLEVDGKLGALSIIALGLGPKRQALQLPAPPTPPGAAQQQIIPTQQFLAKPGETVVREE